MILTGICKLEFEKWIKKQMYDRFESETWFNSLDAVLINCLIMEWFDTTTILIHVHKERSNGFKGYISYEDGDDCLCDGTDSDYENRQEAYKQVIIKANDIYNELNK